MFSSGVILSGSTTFTNLFFRLSPVSFYLAQCDIHTIPKIFLAIKAFVKFSIEVTSPDITLQVPTNKICSANNHHQHTQMKDNTRQYKSSALAAFSAILCASSAGGATVYTNQATFISTINPGYYLENFQATNPPSYNSGGFSYTVSGDTIYDSGSFIGNINQNIAFTITFTSGNVTAVGGDFFINDISDNFLTAPVSITLSDATSISYTPTSQAEFRGFVSNGPIITSLIFGAPGADRFNNLDNLIVGTAIPEPSSIFLMGLGFISSLTYRRRIS
jgi:hypothetical protein